MQCASCRKILSGNSPDILPVSRGDKATLGVEAIRTMHNDVYIAPNELERKIYLIEDAHLMSVQAQNAFLLTLEEPPPYVCFFLLCESTASLLETVRSRAPTLRMEPVPAELIGEQLCKTDSSAAELKRKAPEEFEEMLVAANGSVGRAKQLLDPKQRKPILEQRQIAREFISLCASRHNSASVLAFLTRLGQKREEIITQLNVMLFCVRDLFLCKHSETAPLCFFADREEACALSYQFSAPDLLCYCDSLSNAADRLRMNANVRLTLTNLAIHTGLLS